MITTRLGPYGPGGKKCYRANVYPGKTPTTGRVSRIVSTSVSGEFEDLALFFEFQLTPHNAITLSRAKFDTMDAFMDYATMLPELCQWLVATFNLPLAQAQDEPRLLDIMGDGGTVYRVPMEVCRRETCLEVYHVRWDGDADSLAKALDCRAVNQLPRGFFNLAELMDEDDGDSREAIDPWQNDGEPTVVVRRIRKARKHEL